MIIYNHLTKLEQWRGYVTDPHDETVFASIAPLTPTRGLLINGPLTKNAFAITDDSCLARLPDIIRLLKALSVESCTPIGHEARILVEDMKL